MQEKETNISCIEEHYDEAKILFEEQKMEMSIEKTEEQNVLKIITESGTNYFFHDSYRGIVLDKVEQDACYNVREETINGQLLIRVIDDRTARVAISTDGGFVGVNYFYQILKR